MPWKLLAEVMVAMLSLFGVYCLLKLCASSLFRSEKVGRYVRIISREDAEELDFLLDQAESSLTTDVGPLVVLLSETLALDPMLMEYLERRGIDCYIIED